MKENLLVTLADENFIDQARQLFSSAYWKGGWDGDYMLLAYQIPEPKLVWFRKKGILVKNVSAPPINAKEDDWSLNYSPLILAKFYVFTLEFKKWKHVVFLDSDIMVKADMSGLTRIKGFGAVTDMLPFIENQIDDYTQTTIDKKMVNAKAFNSGMFCFSTDIITEDTFQNICNLADEFVGKTVYFPDQAILNVFFHKKWIRMPFFFNLYYFSLPRRYQNNPSKIKCAVLHFAGKYKPWDRQSPCYREWSDNLRVADLMDLKSPRNGTPYSFNIFSVLYFRYLYRIELRYFLYKFLSKSTKRVGLLLGYFKKDVVLGHGWYVLEYHDILKKSFIWNSRQSEILIYTDMVTGVEFDVMFSPFNKKTFTMETYDRNSLMVTKREYHTTDDTIHVRIDGNVTKIRFSNTTFVPTRRDGLGDIRKLGMMLLSPIILHKKSKTISVPLNRILSYKFLSKIRDTLGTHERY
jgi:lipopolysaccharide biosynthesis glycosyltransferase